MGLLVKRRLNLRFPKVPDLIHHLIIVEITSTESSPSVRRARAGTVPSRFTNPLEDLANLSIQPKHASSSTDLPSQINPLPSTTVTPGRPSYQPPVHPASTVASRLRSGSLTLPRALYQNPSTPFGPSIFSSSYHQRVGLSPASPAQSSFSRDDEHTPVKTLDYLGLADTPTPPRQLRGMPNATVLEQVQETNGMTQRQEEPLPVPGYLSATSRLRDASRIRSYSVADKDKYDEEHAEYEYEGEEDPQVLSQTYIQEVQATPRAQYSHLYAESHSPRPRASTTGVINSPPSLTADLFGGPLRNILESQHQHQHQRPQYQDPPQPTIARPISRDEQFYPPQYTAQDDVSSQPSRALWIATVPQGVTQQHLESIFSQYGAIESSRVLIHKSCGFVNFHTLEDAVAARSALAGRELFPGTGGIKIGFAKVPSGIVMSPSPEPLMQGENMHLSAGARMDGSRSRSPALPPLRQVQTELMQILSEFGAGEEEISLAADSLSRAGSYTGYKFEIPPIPEPSPQRIYDAPKLRDIRKRIDNGTCSPEEIEHIALDMLPEIAELSSDYLGNTVVQKLFENCSENVKTRMLIEIAPYLASIGVHKNGTWAAQKIIDVSKTEDQVCRLGYG
jgi:protein JSN1